MKRLLTLLLILSVQTVVALTCSAGQTYVKFGKQSGSFSANEESYELYASTTKLITSPAFVINDYRESEHCLTTVTSNVWTLKMKDTGNNSWYIGSFLKIMNEYDGIIFQRYMVANAEETFDVLLYTPVKKGSTWKFTNDAASGWTTTSFTDSSWANLNPLSPGAVTTSGKTQYFRINFTGNSAAVAYELSIYYRMGVIVHFNGEEYFRDNMPTGSVSKDTAANSLYPSIEWRGLIRASTPFTTSSNVLAIEVHYQGEKTTFDFDAWLSLYPSSSGTVNNCYVVPYFPTVSTAATNGASGYNFNKGDAITYASPTEANPFSVDMFWQFHFIQINGVEIFPYTSLNYQPLNAFMSLSKSTSSSGTWTMMGNMYGLIYATNTHQYGVFPFQTSVYHGFRFQATSFGSAYAYVYELHGAVCNVPQPTALTFTPNNEVYKVGIDSINIVLSFNGVTGCSLTSGSLPAGLTLSSTSCSITGMATEAKSQTTYTITSTTPALSGTLTFSVEPCVGSVMMIQRNYYSGSMYEGWYITTDSGTEIIRENAMSGVQVDNTVKNINRCVSGNKFILYTSSSSYNFWQVNSYIHIRVPLDNEYETVLTAHYDNYMGFNVPIHFTLKMQIAASSTWKYKFGYTASTWFSESTSDWPGATKGNFGSATNKYQVFRSEFNVDSSDLSTAVGFTVSVRYQYGIILYIGNNELYRNNIAATGELSTIPNAIGFYSSSIYRKITFPLKTMKEGANNPVSLISSGSNNIAVALISQTDTQTTVVFDCAVRIFGNIQEDRNIDLAPTGSGVTGPTAPFSRYYASQMQVSSCADNWLLVTFNDDRREWLSSVQFFNHYNTFDVGQMSQFILEGKNAADTAYTVISTQTGWKWWILGQTKRLYFTNNKSYNMYRFRNMKSPLASCTFRMNQIYLYADKTDVSLQTLTYPAEFTGYLSIEMAEIYPTQGANYRSSFSVSPALPDALFMDPVSGVVMGTANNLSSRTQYTVTAVSVSGETTTASFYLQIIRCTDGKSLISIVIRTDSSPQFTSFNVKQGKTGSGAMIDSRTSLPLQNSKYWVDMCLTHDFYMFTIQTTASSGLVWPGSFVMTVDKDTLALEERNVLNAQPVSFVFSSFLPFEFELTKWRIQLNPQIDMGDTWKAISYVADSTWTEAPLSSIDKPESSTIYVRKEFTIANVDDFPVMNAHVSYVGGVVCFVNGFKVARFNLPVDYSIFTAAPIEHSSTEYSAFSVILSMVGLVAGKNVFAMEHHRAATASSATPIVLDATAVFSAESCSTLSFSLSTVVGSNPTSGDALKYLFDRVPTTYSVLPNAMNTYIEWSLENLEKTQFNRYYFNWQYYNTNFGFTLSGKSTATDEWITMETVTGLATADRTISLLTSHVGMAGFRFFRFAVKALASSNLGFSDLNFVYCREGGAMCVGDKDYPSVPVGARSPVMCGYGYTGYAYRECKSAGVLDAEVHTEFCKFKAPSALKYVSDYFEFVVDTDIKVQEPEYDNIIEKFSLDSSTPMPEGLVLDSITGAITGRVKAPLDEFELKVYGENQVDAVFTSVRLSFRNGRCAKTSEYQQTVVGGSGTFSCSKRGAYIGTLKARCVIGTKDGMWSKSTGYCMPVFLLVVIILLVLLIIGGIAFFVLKRKDLQKKAAERKKSAKGKKKMQKV